MHFFFYKVFNEDGFCYLETKNWTQAQEMLLKYPNDHIVVTTTPEFRSE